MTISDIKPVFYSKTTCFFSFKIVSSIQIYQLNLLFYEKTVLVKHLYFQSFNLT